MLCLLAGATPSTASTALVSAAPARPSRAARQPVLSCCPPLRLAGVRHAPSSTRKLTRCLSDLGLSVCLCVQPSSPPTIAPTPQEVRSPSKCLASPPLFPAARPCTPCCLLRGARPPLCSSRARKLSTFQSSRHVPFASCHRFSLSSPAPSVPSPPPADVSLSCWCWQP